LNALTQVLDRPQTGRIFFEQVIRENLDLGRSDQVQLIFERRVTKRTPGRFRKCILTDGVIPSLHVDYQSTIIKQYHKEGRAQRTETTINNPPDFAINKGLNNLPALRELGFAANRRLLHVQTINHNCVIGEDTDHLRRLRLHGIIERVPKSHRYQITDEGWRTILFCTRSYHRLLRPGLAQIVPNEATPGSTLRQRFDQLDAALDQWIEEHHMAA
jgi:hypothetical protein